MKRLISYALACAFAVAASSAPVTADPSDTTFTYQGHLTDDGQAANGAYDLVVGLFGQVSGGSQFTPVNMFNDVPVVDGVFTVELDYGAESFDNEPRWLEIEVNGMVLSPRQSITRAPYSIQTRGIFVDANHRVGIGTSTPGYPLHVESLAPTAIYARNSGPLICGLFVSETDRRLAMQREDSSAEIASLLAANRELQAQRHALQQLVDELVDHQQKGNGQ